MSSINGDKARFHRDRKRRVARRASYRKMFEGVARQMVVAAPAEAKAPARQS